MKLFLVLLLFIPVAMASLPPGGAPFPCPSPAPQGPCQPMAHRFTPTRVASPDFEFKKLNPSITWSTVTSTNYQALKGNLVIPMGQYAGSGQFKLNFMNGCVDLDLNGKNEFTFMEETVFQDQSCEHKITDSSHSACLNMVQIQWLKDRNFKIEGVKTCSYTQKLTTLNHDLVFDNVEGQDLALLSDLEHINGQFVCEDSVISNLDFLKKLKTINENPKRDITPLTIKNCLVLDEPKAFLPKIRKISKLDNQNIPNSVFDLTTFKLSEEEQGRLRSKTDGKSIDFKEDFEIYEADVDVYDSIDADSMIIIAAIPFILLITVIILSKKKVKISKDYRYRNSEYMTMELEAMTDANLVNPMLNLYSKVCTKERRKAYQQLAPAILLEELHAEFNWENEQSETPAKKGGEEDGVGKT